jgi:LPXTG-motif cell wall-anchored protein
MLAIALMAPSAAFAQSAGDEQYSDPFAEEQDNGQDGSTGSSGDTGSVSTQTTDTGTGTEDTVVETSADDGAVLPVTGAPIAALAALGAGLLAGGALLRRRT